MNHNEATPDHCARAGGARQPLQGATVSTIKEEIPLLLCVTVSCSSPFVLFVRQEHQLISIKEPLTYTPSSHPLNSTANIIFLSYSLNAVAVADVRKSNRLRRDRDEALVE